MDFDRPKNFHDNLRGDLPTSFWTNRTLTTSHSVMILINTMNIAILSYGNLNFSKVSLTIKINFCDLVLETYVQCTETVFANKILPEPDHKEFFYSDLHKNHSRKEDVNLSAELL